jgi:hypothetical protein
MSAKQRDMVAAIVARSHEYQVRMLRTVEPVGTITRADIDAEIARLSDPAVTVAAIQQALNERAPVRATIDAWLASDRALRTRTQECERKAAQRNSAAPTGTLDVQDGQTYRTPDGRVFHAYRTQRGVLCVKLWDADADAFEYYGAATRMPAGAVLMSREDAAEFGKATGTCCVCMRHLTDDESVARGIGPVCASKF